MSRRGKVFVAIAVAVVLVALLVWRFGAGPTVFDRTYEGKDLRDWVKEWEEEHDHPAGRERARGAISVLCSNQLPGLVGEFDYDMARRFHMIMALRPTVLRDWLLMRAPPWLLAGAQAERADMALVALWALGDEAAPAIPQITNLLASTNRSARTRGLMVLPLLGTNGFGCFRSILTDEKHPHRAEAVEMVSSLRYNLGTNAMLTLMPTILQCLHAPDQKVASAAADTLGALGLEPDITVPALVSAMTNVSSDVRVSVVQALGDLGTNATAAIPVLTRALTDPVKEVREEAKNALGEIQK